MGSGVSPADETAGDRRRADLSVLVVDDSLVNRDVIRRMLERFGCHVTAVADGLAAVEAVRRNGHQVVFMDVQMPGLDGFAATAAIRALPGEGRRAWIVALTANAFEEDVRRCRDAGMDDFLAKPVTLAELGACLGRLPAELPGRGAAPEA